jgi:hypothetical protein
MVFIDFRTGEAHKVYSVRKLSDGEMVQTFPAKTLTEEALVALRTKSNFKVDELLRANEVFQILE